MSTVIATGATRGQKPSSNGRLTAALESKLKNPVSSPEFDLLANTNNVLSDIGLTAADSGGRLSFYGQDPIISSPHRFGAMAAIGLAAKSVAAAALWRARTGEGQDIHVDVRKALRRFCGFFDGKWETINGRAPAMGGFAGNPFLELPLFRKTRDGRYVVALDFYPRSKTDTLKFLRCTDSLGSIENAILQWRAEELETAAAEEGLVLAMVRTTEEFLNEPQYTEVLSTMPLITVEKIGETGRP
jgi:crotonobetainyl-CoA:carnitine CoA-transferase CaiB-like acyl-CoA transferase